MDEYIPTIWEELVVELKEKGLKFNNLEAVVIPEEFNKSMRKGRIINYETANLILNKARFIDKPKGEFKEPDNLPFLAYTKEKIFFVKLDYNSRFFCIDSIPRNPSTEEPYWVF